MKNKPLRYFFVGLVLVLGLAEKALENLSNDDTTRRQLQRLNDDLYKAASDLGTFSIVQNYLDYLSNGSHIRSGMLHKPKSSTAVPEDPLTKLYWPRSPVAGMDESFAKLQEVQAGAEQFIAEASWEKAEKEDSNPIRFFVPARHLGAVVYTLTKAACQGWVSFVMTIIAIGLAILFSPVIELYQKKNWLATLAAIALALLIATLLMLVLKAIMLATTFIFGRFLEVSANTVAVGLLILLLSLGKEVAEGVKKG